MLSRQAASALLPWAFLSGNPDLLLDLAHTRAESDQIIGGRSRLAALGHLRLFQSFQKNPLQIGSSDRFREMIECSKLHGLNGIGTIGKSGNHDDRSCGPCFTQKIDS